MSTYQDIDLDLDNHHSLHVNAVARAVIRLTDREGIIEILTPFPILLAFGRISRFSVQVSEDRIFGSDLADDIVVCLLLALRGRHFFRSQQQTRLILVSDHSI